VVRGALAAAVTPLRDGGASLDEDAFEPLLAFYAQAGLDGLLALGTTGEGIALSREERMRAAQRFLDGSLPVIVHAGAQTTADTVALAQHAASAGAAGVAVIAPPYFALDGPAILAHLEAAAGACAPVPFYAYEFERASGYAVPPVVIEELRGRAENLAGLKVSDTPFSAVEPYLVEGLDVFIGNEALLHAGLERGAAGGVSGLASVFPERVVEVVRAPSAEGAAALGELRAALERYPRHAAFKFVLGLRGVPIREDVRAPLRPLTELEREELRAWHESS
jgi:dihydrodipicolinate synthase/N-acetylneuraminate lyase